MLVQSAVRDGGLPSLLSVLAAIFVVCVTLCAADERKIDSDLVGTWVSKSEKVKTGPVCWAYMDCWWLMTAADMFVSELLRP